MSEKERIVGMLGNLDTDNRKFVQSHLHSAYFDEFISSQHPRLTLVTCIDSRVHSHAYDQTPDNDIMTVRNLSGQHESGKAGIAYGVKHAKTPLLLVMGHDDCGAVFAKTKVEWLEWKERNGGIPKEYDALREWLTELRKDPDIINELKAIKIARRAVPPAQGGNADRFNWLVHENIKFNTHHQVDECLRHFHKEVESGKLIIAGALYDFQGSENQGRGRLIWLDARDQQNVNHFIGTNEQGRVTALKTTGAQHQIKGQVRVHPTDEELVDDGKDASLYAVEAASKAGVDRLQALIASAPKEL